MTKTPDDVKHVAKLARLQIPREQESVFVDHINKVLEYVDQLSEVETENLLPFFSPAKEHVHLYQEQTRPDQIRESLGADLILRNAPSSFQHQFAVEAIIEENE